MTYFAAALVSSLLLVGALAAIYFQVRSFWSDILSALAGQVPQRRRLPVYSRVRASRPRPVIVVRSVRQQWRAAS